MNPTTAKIFVFFKLHPNNEVSIRKLCEIVDVKSPSTVSWHLNKLVGAGLMEQDVSNRYVLTNMGRDLTEVQIPTTISAQIIKGYFVPKYSLLSVIFFFSLVFNLIMLLIGFSLGVIIINSFLMTIIAFLLFFRDWSKFKKQFQISENFK
ncbi:MAG: hypothetical protein HeimC2_28430 [Candidatus Heimdallarchaeota archaeon LC_2]|nr:MAG: hypothetical protein HeimC2_28430 [Candidatus Heimdallarchaeota archaeon LC_2]